MNEPSPHTESISIEERIDILTHHWPRFFRWFVIATKAFLFHHGTIRAAALTYTSFLAVVPLLILLTTITLAMGMGSFFSDYLPILDHLLSLNLPLDSIMPLLQNAEHISLQSLGLIGSLGLFITFILAIGSLEINMNVVWENQISRPVLKQIFAYIPLLLILAGSFGAFAAVIGHTKTILLQIAIDNSFISVHSVGAMIKIFWIIDFNIVVLLLIFFAMYLLPFRKGQVSYKRLLLPSLGASVAVWAATYIYLIALIILQTNLITRMSLFYGSLAFIPLVLLFAFGFWAIMLYGNCLVWTIYDWPHSAQKEWNWIGTKGGLQ